MAERETGEKCADIAICVASCRRPEGLQALLGGLQAQVFPGAAPRLCVHVADNDPGQSARPVVEAARSWFGHDIEYVWEARPGIPQARNATLYSALGTAAWLAFVDDDEVPDVSWLACLLETQEASGADVVTGPVVARYPATAPAWVAAGGFFDPPRHPTGTELRAAYTNNVLVRADAVAALRGGFDEGLRLGEDTELFERLSAAGRRIVWCDEAVVYDSVAAERTNWRWLVARSFQNGVARTRIERRRSPVGGVATSLSQGLRRLGAGTLAAGRAAGTVERVRGLQVAATGAGRLAGLLGRR